jgi:hypothetical protein
MTKRLQNRVTIIFKQSVCGFAMMNFLINLLFDKQRIKNSFNLQGRSLQVRNEMSQTI